MKTHVLFTAAFIITLMGAMSLQSQTTDYPGTALEFDGIDDYVSVPSSTSLNNPNFTVEFWIKPGSSPSIVIDNSGSNQANWYFAYQLVGQNKIITFHIDEGTGSNEIETNWQDTLWHHVAGIYDGNYMKLYLDGALQSEMISGYYSTAKDLFIGSYGGSADFFEGSLDEIAMWDLALPEYLIREYMNLTYHDFGGSLISY